MAIGAAMFPMMLLMEEIRIAVSGSLRKEVVAIPLGMYPWRTLCRTSQWQDIATLSTVFLHQQAGLSTGTITNNDEFATNLSHDG